MPREGSAEAPSPHRRRDVAAGRSAFRSVLVIDRIPRCARERRVGNGAEGVAVARHRGCCRARRRRRPCRMGAVAGWDRVADSPSASRSPNQMRCSSSTAAPWPCRPTDTGWYFRPEARTAWSVTGCGRSTRSKRARSRGPKARSCRRRGRPTAGMWYSRLSAARR